MLHNLVLETTRSGIELKNMKMRLEALSSRLEFSERRVRALEGVVQYRPEIVRVRDRDRERRPRAAGPTGDQRGASLIPPRRERRRRMAQRCQATWPRQVCQPTPAHVGADDVGAGAAVQASPQSAPPARKLGADSRGAACGRYPR